MLSCLSSHIPKTLWLVHQAPYVVHCNNLGMDPGITHIDGPAKALSHIERQQQP